MVCKLHTYVHVHVYVTIGECGLMWVDKYRPRTLKNIIGQQGDKSNAKKLLRYSIYSTLYMYYYIQYCSYV